MSYGMLRALAAVSAVTVSACDPSWSLEVTASVSPEVQAAVSYPTQLLVVMEKLYRQDDTLYQPSDAGPHQLVVACEASSEPIVATWRFSSLGCGVETLVLAWLTPLDLAAGQSCAPARPGTYASGEPASLTGPTAPAAGEPAAEGVAFSSEHGDDCKSGSDRVQLELQLP